MCNKIREQLFNKDLQPMNEKEVKLYELSSSLGQKKDERKRLKDEIDFLKISSTTNSYYIKCNEVIS